MCQSCDDGAASLARLVIKDLDFSHLPVPPLRVKPKNVRDGEIRLYHNGSIITMKDGKLSPVEAMAVRGDTIMAVGTLESVKQAVSGSSYTDCDLGQDRCMLPGFVEPHLHVLNAALASDFFLHFSPDTVTTRKQALELVERTANDEQHKKDSKLWIAGFGYDPSRIDGHLELDRCQLDKPSPTNPVFIINQSGHLAYANSAALTLAGKTDDNTHVEDGYMKDKDGHLTGVLKELAVAGVGGAVTAPTMDEIAKSWNKTIQSWVELGHTTISDQGIGIIFPKNDITTYKHLTTVFPPPVRIHAALALQVAQPYQHSTPPVQLGQVKVQAIKFWADGSTQGFTAAVKEPYMDNPPSCGKLNFEKEDELYKAVEPYFANGWQITIHSNGDRASDQVLDVYEKLFKNYPARAEAQMHRIEHFTVTSPEQVQKAAKLGLGVSHTIGHVHYWGRPFVEYVLGSPRAERIHAIKDDQKYGAVFSFHSDSPVTNVSPLLWVRTAVTRLMQWDKEKKDERVLGEKQKVSLETALCGITINPAKQLGADNEIGTLEVGKKADFVILDRDIRKVPPEDIDSLNVEETWMGGVQTYSRDS